MGLLSVLFGTEKEKQLFLRLNAVADYEVEAAQTFLVLCQNPDKANEYGKKLRSIEHDCDQVVKQIFDILDTTFQLPFHHDDIAELVKNMDSVVDCIWGAVDRIVFRYELPAIGKETELLKLVEVLVLMTTDLNAIVRSLKNIGKIKDLSQLITKSHSDENKADDLREEALKRWHQESLRDLPNTPLILFRIAWTEVYDRLDWATNKCVDVTDVLGRIYKKYS